MELRHLRYFVAVAEELHFGRAAQRLHLAQPPLSRQIQALERELGVPLFTRHRRRVALTAAGETFLEGARRVLASADDVVRDAQRAQRGEIGRLALGFVGSAAYTVLPRILRAFRERYPLVELSLQAMTTQEQVAALQDRRIGAGILRPPVDEGSFALQPLLREPLVAALPEDHPLAAQERVPLVALAGESFVLYPRADGPAVHDAIVSLCVEAGFSPRIVQESGEMQTIAGLVAGGIGVALVIAPAERMRSRGVVYRPLADVTRSWELALAWRRDEASPVAGALLAAARGCMPFDDVS